MRLGANEKELADLLIYNFFIMSANGLEMLTKFTNTSARE
jgi:hypothetical protein